MMAGRDDVPARRGQRNIRAGDSDVDGPKKQQRKLQAAEASLHQFVLLRVYILMAITGLGYLALTWSTVVLLGGFVTSLGKKDFWCLTAISMIQAARIFNDLGELVMLNFFELVLKVIFKALNSPNPSTVVLLYILLLPVILVLEIIYVFGSIICLALSLWRIGKRDYSNMDGDNTKANLMPALDIFYCLVICQGMLFIFWSVNAFTAISFVDSLHQACKFPEMWGSVSSWQYFSDTRGKCWRDLASIKSMSLITYAVGLLDSELQEDYISGARMLDVFIKQGVDVRSLILPSRTKIQKLIDTLGWRSSDREIRELAARIVAYLASDIHLAQFPGAIRCISSLLDTTLPYWNNQQGPNHQSPQIMLKQPTDREAELIFRDKRMERRRQQRRRKQEGVNRQDDMQQKKVHSSIDDREGHGWNELILQGLTILEKLGFDQHNCRDICNTPDLLTKIMTPIYSDTLIQDMNISARADVVNGSFRVVNRLIRAPGWTGRRLRCEILSSKQAVRHLEKIIDESNEAGQELQMRAIEILTELAFDSSTNLSTVTKQSLINKQLQIFLTDDEEEEPATKSIKKQLKVTAGKTLALLSKTELLSKTGTICVFIMSKYEYIVDHVTDILDAKNKTRYRTIAAEILENLCTYHTMDKEHVKNTLLPKIFKEVLTSTRKPPTEAPQREPHWFSEFFPWYEDEEIDELSSEEDDEENQVRIQKGQIKSSDQAREEQTAMKELQEALLSLTLVICDKEIISAEDVGDVARKISPAEGAFVARLKIIVEDNSQATADCLRIVKLCSQIAVSMMRCNQFTVHFKDQKFVESLSKASEIMSNLESCMFYAGTDCGVKKTVRPFLSDLEKDLKEALSPVG